MQWGFGGNAPETGRRARQRPEFSPFPFRGRGAGGDRMNTPLAEKKRLFLQAEFYEVLT